mgnify:CR=1 FL=1
MDKISKLISEMIDFDAGNPQRIQHFIKVHEFSRLIGIMKAI